MVKLYRLTNTKKEYWETWENDGVHTIHWGILGTKGNSKEIKSSFFKKAEKIIQKEIDLKLQENFQPIEIDDHDNV